MVKSMSKNFKELIQDDRGDLSINRLTGIPNINSPQPPGDISTWFLGTRAENGAEFKELIAQAVDHIIEYRQTYLPEDPETLTPEVKSSPEYRDKMGYIPYPAGGNLYRNGQLKNLTIYAGSYIGATQSIRPQEPSVAIYGLEGSKLGARAAAVFLSHQVIRPSVSGYGKIVSQSMFNTKLFCLRLLLMATEQDNFIMVPLPRLSIEREGSNGDKESYLATLRSLLYGKTQDEILADPEAMAMFREIGCDQNILCYAFNFKRQDGSINDDPELFFKLTDLVYDRFHVHYYQDGKAEDIHKYRFFLTSTIFQKDDYGPTFIENYAKRLGLSKTPDSIKVLRSIVMDPYVSDLPDWRSFFDEIIETLRSNVTEIIEQNFR